MSSETRRLGHKPALDGLRAVAVLAVMAFHLGPQTRVSAGYLGVDVFFVLSGFLITTLLLEEHDRRSRISAGHFWARRARRLLPAVAVVLGLVAIYTWRYAPADQVATLRADVWASAFYAQNWHNLAAPAPFVKPLGHLWSLAVEEQFYLLWPLVVLLCLGRPSARLATSVRRSARVRRRLAWVCVIGIAMSATLAWWLSTHGHVEHAYGGTDTRAHQVLLGALLAVALPHLQRWSRTLAVLGTLALGGVVWFLVFGPAHDAPGFPGPGTLGLAVLVALVIASATQTGLVARGLSWKPLAAIGLISYGLYLWHWPIDVLLTQERLGMSYWPRAILVTTLTFALAWFSYVWIEAPIRFGRAPIKWSAPIPRPAAVAALATVLVAVPVAARVGVHSAPIPSAQVAGAVMTPPPVEPVTVDAPRARERLRVLVVGDGLAAGIGDRLPDLLGNTATVAVRAQRGTDLVSDPASLLGLRSELDAFSPQVVIAHSSAEGSPLPVDQRDAPRPGADDWYATWGNGMHGLVDAVAAHQAGLYVPATPRLLDAAEDRRAAFLSVLWQGETNRVAFVDARASLLDDDGEPKPGVDVNDVTAKAIAARLRADWCLNHEPGCTPQYSTTPPLPRDVPEDRTRVLLVGDSLMWQLAPELTARFVAEGAAVLSAPRSATSIPGPYDWPARMDSLVTAWQPDVVVVHFFPEFTRASDPAYADQWHAAVADATKRLSAHGARVVWLESPTPPQPDAAALAARLVTFVPSAAVIDPSNILSKPSRVPLRFSDPAGHFTSTGVDIVSALITREVGQLSAA